MKSFQRFGDAAACLTLAVAANLGQMLADFLVWAADEHTQHVAPGAPRLAV